MLLNDFIGWQCLTCFSRRFQSLTGQETICFGSSASRAATNSELEAWKQELLAEVRTEIQTVKLEIIEGRFFVQLTSICVFVAASK